MARNKKSPADEDENQSQRFVETARALEADGELSLTEAEERLDRLLSAAAPKKVPPAQR